MLSYVIRTYKNMHATGMCFFFFKQKTAYEMRISDWSSDVCSSDLPLVPFDDIMLGDAVGEMRLKLGFGQRCGEKDTRIGLGATDLGDRQPALAELGRASCRERVCQYV